jgi:putative flippase GtrA
MLYLMKHRFHLVYDWFISTRLGHLITDGEGASTLLKFVAIGTIGYLVNQIGLFLAYDTGLLPFLPPPNTDVHLGFFSHRDERLLYASIIAVELSIFSNFFWHEHWTFRSRSTRGHWTSRLVRFNITSLGSPIVSVLVVNVLVPYFGIDKYIANTIGVLLGLSWNWAANTRIIWRRHEPAVPPVTEVAVVSQPAQSGFHD